jgi:hypothetical protein
MTNPEYRLELPPEAAPDCDVIEGWPNVVRRRNMGFFHVLRERHYVNAPRYDEDRGIVARSMESGAQECAGRVRYPTVGASFPQQFYPYPLKSRIDRFL